MHKIIMFMIAMTSALFINAQSYLDRISIIPLPDSIKAGPGEYTITRATTIYYNDENCLPDINLFITYLNEKYGIEVPVRKSTQLKARNINIITVPGRDEETYKITVDSTVVSIE